MSNRTTVIVSILEQFDELANPLWSTSGGGSGGPAKMPATYNASVREVERLVRVMPSVRPSQAWHLTERYFRCQRSTQTVRFLRGRFVGLQPHCEVVGRPGGWELVLAEQRQKRTQTPTEMRAIVVTWNPAVRMQKVEAGVQWLADQWALQHEPFLHVEKLAA